MAGKLVKAVRRGQRGMTTAEYAVGSVAVATGVGTLVWLFEQPWFKELLKIIVKALFDVIQQMITGQ
jgi:hypothetical protein